jgi:hypothetical protein
MITTYNMDFYGVLQQTIYCLMNFLRQYIGILYVVSVPLHPEYWCSVTFL